MATLPQPKKEKATASVEAKGRLLVKRIKELVATNARLSRRAEEQEARIDELNRRLSEMENVRATAIKRLKKLANQLPGN